MNVSEYVNEQFAVALIFMDERFIATVPDAFDLYICPDDASRCYNRTIPYAGHQTVDVSRIFFFLAIMIRLYDKADKIK